MPASIEPSSFSSVVVAQFGPLATNNAQTPPGPEGSNGSVLIVCRGVAGLGCFQTFLRFPRYLAYNPPF